jgi:hypothetical protein
VTPTCSTCGSTRVRWATRKDGSSYLAITVPEGDGERPRGYWVKVARQPHAAVCIGYPLEVVEDDRNAKAYQQHVMVEDALADLDGVIPAEQFARLRAAIAAR